MSLKYFDSYGKVPTQIGTFTQMLIKVQLQVYVCATSIPGL